MGKNGGGNLRIRPIHGGRESGESRRLGERLSVVSAAPAIEVSALSKSYPVPKPLWSVFLPGVSADTRLALDRVTFSVAQGEVLGLLGPNGAGKTTLINILCSLLTPTSGEVRVGGHDLRSAAKQARRLVGLVTSNERSFYWRLTGRQNLHFFAELYHVSGDDADHRIAEFLEALDLAEYADRRFDSYSTGIRQRFAFARALLHKPRILFMDEPTKGLDPNASVALLQLIQDRILKTWRPTIIITSHNLTEIETLCDRVAIVDHGRLLRIGTIGELARSFRSYEVYAVQVAGVDDVMLAGLGALLGANRVRVREGPVPVLELGLGDGNRSLSEALQYILVQGGEIRRCEPMEVSLADVFRETVEHRNAA
jgi:ABC-2 type transport system ATP-binding protein